MKTAYLYLIRDLDFKNLAIVASYAKYEEDLIGWLHDVSSQGIWLDSDAGAIKVERLHILDRFDISKLLANRGMI